MQPVKLTADLIEAMAGTFLSPRYDDPRPTPDFHREAWELYASEAKNCLVIAPRDHAKTTGLTFDYVMAEVLFRASDYVIIISSTEEMAQEMLSNISEELHTNDELRREFRVKKFLVDAKTEIIVEMADRHRFRILARGAEQRIRGRMWNGKRPNLMVCHKKGTRIVDDGKEMLVEEHPTASLVTRYGLTIGIHGLPFYETVTPEHRYWVKKIRQKKCAEYKNGVKVRNYTQYIESLAGWCEAQDLDKTCWLGRPVDMTQVPWGNGGLFSGDFWWLLGLWWGDGTADTSRNRVAWVVADKDRLSIGARVKSFFALHGIHVSESQRQGCFSLTVTHWGLSHLLKSWCFGNSQKKAPLWVMQLPLEQQADIIKGYVAADGYIDQKTQQVRLTSVCYPALFQVREMLARLGVVGTIRQGKYAGQEELPGHRICNTQTKYDLMFRDGASKLGYDITDSERYTLKRVFIADGFIWSQVHESFQVSSQEFVPIQTASHTYLTDFSLSHNCDDMEDDEQVENRDRRLKFRKWFFRAAKQALSKRGKIRVHGTILHEDSLLARLRTSSTWVHRFYKAHAAFDDFSEILWPERWTEEELRQKRQEFIDDGDSAGYSQEMLNDPMDSDEAFLKKEEFLGMREEDYESDKIICASADFAISKSDKANRTSFTIGGKDVNNILHFVDQHVGRWDTLEIIEKMFAIQNDHSPLVFWVEDGQIWKALSPLVYREMALRDTWINIEAITPVKDKAVRGRSWQKRMRARGCRFDKSAGWYPGFENECLKFTGYSEATLDDQFDSAALLSRGFDNFHHVEEDDFFEDEDWAQVREDPRRHAGRNAVTGY